MQAHAVVDAIHVPVDTAQDVAALPVRVVDQHVENGHPAQPDIVGVHQGDLVAGIVVGLQHGQEAGREMACGQQVDEVGPGRGFVADVVAGLVDPQLQHAASGGPVANDGVGHDVPAECSRDQIGAALAACKGAIRKVPQRSLALDGLVHAMCLQLTEMRLAEEGGVAR